MLRLGEPKRRQSLALAGLLGALLFLSTGAWAQGDAFVEGYVFNKNIGVPLQGAAVTLSVLVEPSQDFRSFSDGNGFYSFKVPTTLGLVALNATCGTGERTAVSGHSHLVDLREGTIRRDLYIDVGWRRTFSQCLSAGPLFERR